MTKAGREGGKSLATHLFAILFSFAFISFVAATAIAAYISWTVYEGDAEQRLTAQLEVCAAQIDDMDSEEMVAKLSGVDLANTRITLVASDGSVLYDSEVDAKDMKNHGSRQEIVAAQNIGVSGATQVRDYRVGFPVCGGACRAGRFRAQACRDPNLPDVLPRWPFGAPGFGYLGCCSFVSVDVAGDYPIRDRAFTRRQPRRAAQLRNLQGGSPPAWQDGCATR